MQALATNKLIISDKHLFLSTQSLLFQLDYHIQEDFTEKELLDLLQFHRLEEFFYDKIKSVNSFSSDFSKHLRASIQEKKINSLSLFHELIGLINLFDKNKIDYITLKGPILSYRLYDDFAKRTSRDLDLLIHLENFEQVEEILIQRGFERIDTICKTAKQKKYFEKYKSQVSYYHSTSHVTVEIHWKLFSTELISPLFLQSCWDKKTTIIFKNYTFKVLCDEDEFIYLTIHGIRHYWFRLFWLKDIDTILLNKADDFYSTVLNQSITFQLKKFVEISNSFLDALKGENKLDSSTSLLLEMSKLKYESLHSNFPTYKRIKTYFLHFKMMHHLHGMKGFIFETKSKNFKPENWSYYVFPDRLFFLNFIFCKMIYFLRKLCKK